MVKYFSESGKAMNQLTNNNVHMRSSRSSLDATRKFWNHGDDSRSIQYGTDTELATPQVRNSVWASCDIFGGILPIAPYLDRKMNQVGNASKLFIPKESYEYEN